MQTYMGDGTEPFGKDLQSYKPAASTAGTETMTRNFSPNDNNDDLAVIAVKQLAASSSPPAPIMIPYRQAFTYDWLGNLLSVTNGATSTATGTTPHHPRYPPLSTYKVTNATSDSRSYTVPRRLEQAVHGADCADQRHIRRSATLNGSVTHHLTHQRHLRSHGLLRRLPC